MAGNGKAPVLVVVQLSGGNDFMNTIVPYTNGHYYDARPVLNVPQEQVLPLNDTLGFHPNAEALKDLYEEGVVAVVQGIGYPDSNRSHFRGMDIWHTCEPDRLVLEGWLGKVLRELDPDKENVLTGVSFGRGLPRAMAASGVPVTSVADLDTYGLLGGIGEAAERQAALQSFQTMYAPGTDGGGVMDYLAQTGLDVLTGADIIKQAPAMYESTVQYADNPIAKSLRDVARVHTAGLGTRIFYTQHGGYDTHATQAAVHPRLLSELDRRAARFHAGPARARRLGRSGDSGVHRVRPAHQGQRQRHRSRLRRRRLHHRRPGERRPVRRIPVAGPGGLAVRRRHAPQHRLPRHLRHHAGAVDGHGRDGVRRRYLRAVETVQERWSVIGG